MDSVPKGYRPRKQARTTDDAAVDLPNGRVFQQFADGTEHLQIDPSLAGLVAADAGLASTPGAAEMWRRFERAQADMFASMRRWQAEDEERRERMRAKFLAEELESRLGTAAPTAAESARADPDVSASTASTQEIPRARVVVVQRRRRAGSGPVGRRRKERQYDRFVELWWEYVAQYSPGAGQRYEPTISGFVQWLAAAYPLEKVGLSKLSGLRDEWALEGSVFPPADR